MVGHTFKVSWLQLCPGAMQNTLVKALQCFIPRLTYVSWSLGVSVLVLGVALLFCFFACFWFPNPSRSGSKLLCIRFTFAHNFYILFAFFEKRLKPVDGSYFTLGDDKITKENNYFIHTNILAWKHSGLIQHFLSEPFVLGVGCHADCSSHWEPKGHTLHSTDSHLVYRYT